MTKSNEKKSSGSMTYPTKGTLNRALFKIPLLWWRTGVGSIMSHPARGGSKVLVFTTWGRVSSLPRHTMVSYTLFNGKPYIASGWGGRTDWYKNILANPAVTVQIGGNVFSARARRVMEEEEFTDAAKSLFDSGGDSHFEDWLGALDIEMDPQDMIAKRDRVYFITFDPAEVDAPPPLRADLIWVWSVVLLPLGYWLWKRLSTRLPKN